MKTKSFGDKCKCGHLESEHASQKVDSPKSIMHFQMEPKGHLPMGMAPTISYDPRRDKCGICNCKRFESNKRRGLFQMIMHGEPQ